MRCSSAAPYLLASLLVASNLSAVESVPRQLVLKLDNDYCAGLPSSDFDNSPNVELVTCQKNTNSVSSRQLWEYSSMSGLLRLDADTDYCAAIDVPFGDDVADGSTADIILVDCDSNDPRQDWTYIVDDEDDDAYFLKNEENDPDMCLTYSGTNPSSGDELIVETCPNNRDSDFQWDFNRPPSGSGELVYLDNECDRCVGVDYDQGENAQIRVVDCERADAEDKFWFIDSGSSPSWCLDYDRNLCIQEVNTDELELREISSSQNQEFLFNANSRSEIEARSSGRCVTLDGGVGSLVTTENCNAGSIQRFSTDTYDDWDDECNGGGGGGTGGILIYLNDDCTECIGVGSDSDGNELRIVDCDSTSSTLKYWELGSGSDPRTWCLDSNTNLCVVRGSNDRLELDDSNADDFDFNSLINGMIERGTSNQCVERIGNTVELNTCSSSDIDQRWDKTDFSDWDNECNGGGGGTGGILVYLNDDCTECIGVGSDSDGSELRIVDCDSTHSDRKYWELGSGSDPRTWCLDSNTNLCVVRGSNDRLELDDSNADDFDFNSDINTVIERGSSNQCVERNGNIVELNTCSSSDSDQRWDKTDFSDWDDECNGGTNPTSNLLIYLYDDCEECIGIDSSDTLVAVDCETERNDRKYWQLSGGSDPQRWCLDSNTNLCVERDGSRLILRNSNGDDFDFNSDRNDEIEWDPNSNLCLEFKGSGNDIELETCNSGISDQQWNRDDFNDWDNFCDGRSGGGSSSGNLLYLDSSCATCIGVPTNPGVGSRLRVVNCESATNQQKLWTYEHGSTSCNDGGALWCLADDGSLCVDPSDMTLQTGLTGQSKYWCGDNSEIQLFNIDNQCVGSDENSIVLTNCDAPVYSFEWTAEDPDAYDCDQLDGRDPCADGTLIYVRNDCEKCIGAVGPRIGLVDCINAADADKLWDFTNEGNWCLTSSSNDCVGPDLTLQPPSTNQNDDWTYSDTTQIGSAGQYKIARYVSPNTCIDRNGNSLGLDDRCSSGGAEDFGQVNACDYRCFGTNSDEGPPSPAIVRKAKTAVCAYLVSLLIAGIYAVC